MIKNYKLRSSSYVLIGLFSSALTMRISVAAENPVDTLPRVNVPSTAPKTQVTVDQQQNTLSPEVQKILATEIQPASFGLYGVNAARFNEVSAFFAPMANKKTTIAELIKLSNKVTEFYQQRGFPLSFCYIPAQNFNEQIIKVVVIEGYVGSIRVTGTPGATEGKIRDIAGHMLTEKPLTKATMDKYSSMLGLLPGMRIQASLPLPANIEGSSELLLNVERKAVDLSGRVEAINPYLRGVVTARASGNTSLAEEVTLSTLISKENEQYYAATYTQPIGKEGLMLLLDASTYDGKPNTDLAPGLRRDVTSLRLSTGLSYPLMLKRNQSLIGSVSLVANNFDDQIRSKDTGRRINTISDVRTAVAGLTYTQSSTTYVRRMQLMLSKGLDSLGASKETNTNFIASKLDNPIDLNFTKLGLNFLQKNFFEKGWGTTISAMAQYSSNDLPITERVIFGGYQYGRAFTPGRISGDSGWGLALELNRVFPLSYKLPFYELSGLQPYILAEAARIHDNTDRNAEDNLGSVAIGVKLIKNDADRSTIDLSLAKGLSGGKESGVAFGFNFGILY